MCVFLTKKINPFTCPDSLSFIIEVLFLELKLSLWEHIVTSMDPYTNLLLPSIKFVNTLLDRLLDLELFESRHLVQERLIERGCSVVWNECILTQWMAVLCVSHCSLLGNKSKPLPHLAGSFLPTIHQCQMFFSSPGHTNLPSHCCHHQHCLCLIINSRHPSFCFPLTPVLSSSTCLLHWLVPLKFIFLILLCPAVYLSQVKSFWSAVKELMSNKILFFIATFYFSHSPSKSPQAVPLFSRNPFFPSWVTSSWQYFLNFYFIIVLNYAQSSAGQSSDLVPTLSNLIHMACSVRRQIDGVIHHPILSCQSLPLKRF